MYTFFGVRSKNEADIRKNHLPPNLDLAFNQPLLTAGWDASTKVSMVQSAILRTGVIFQIVMHH